ncbi:Eukaryotic aspartyl protease family protein [Forsythia ovata]|uniref:Eukaryotic aspartyl protease family protein n=1 Tax=Forsythia ovata TaxID=205694 RepID=A0ABD1WIQ1_9LAMI
MIGQTILAILEIPDLQLIKFLLEHQSKTQRSQNTIQHSNTLLKSIKGHHLYQGYVSSTYRPARCRSTQCSLARASGCGECCSPPRPGYNNNTCGILPDNTVTQTATSRELASDFVSIQSTDGRNPDMNVSVS